MDYEQARRNFVDSQIRPNDVTSPALIRAFRTVPRERFAPKALQPLAYMEGDLEIAPGRYLLDGRDYAKLVDAADIGPSDIVLDIGCASGYSSAVLSQLCETVVAVECDPDLAARATKILNELDIGNVVVVEGALPDGKPDQAPFDVIVVNGAVAREPETLLEQLGEGGRLVAFVADGPLSIARLYTRRRGVIGRRDLFDARAPLLPGFEPVPAFEF